MLTHLSQYLSNEIMVGSFLPALNEKKNKNNLLIFLKVGSII